MHVNLSLGRMARSTIFESWWHYSIVNLVMVRQYLIAAIHLSLNIISVSNLGRGAILILLASVCVS